MRTTDSRVTRICKRCGSSFKVYPSALKYKKCLYCSTECRAGYSSEDSLAERLSAKTLPANEKGCMEWSGYTNAGGYGSLMDRGKNILAHRLAWEIHNKRKVPTGLKVCHTCDNPPCLTPAHLFVGTQRVNVEDREKKGRSRGPKGESNHHSKLTDKKVLHIREVISNTPPSMKGAVYKDLADKYSVSVSSVVCAASGRYWRHLPTA